MRIWRVENDKGEGCYYGQPTEYLLRRHNNNNTHPTTLADRKIGRIQRKNEISGFVDRDKALDWFNPYELGVLRRIGFELKLIEVEEITEVGTYQVLAVKKDNNLAEKMFGSFCGCD